MLQNLQGTRVLKSPMRYEVSIFSPCVEIPETRSVHNVFAFPIEALKATQACNTNVLLGFGPMSILEGGPHTSHDVTRDRQQSRALRRACISFTVETDWPTLHHN